ncbi:MAG: SDR family NAD(P)-dependent oxidoreductase [Alphaproteobacteria bacterium]
MIAPHTPSFRLDGRRALVTGGSSGLGFGCAAALAQAGAHVVLSSRNPGRLADAEGALAGEGWSVENVPLDVTDLEASQSVIADSEPFDILINSAGLARHMPAVETTAEDYDAVMSVNVRAAYFMSRAVAKKLIAAGRGGSIITVSSQMGHVGGVDRAVYCASKHAVEGFTKAMAIEWGPHRIRVNTVAPTFVRTPLTAKAFAKPERRKWIESKIKLGRIGEVEDIMGAVVYLASDASALVTGTSLLVDGGWTAD